MKDLEVRIQKLEDIEAIKQLKARYWFACDQRDAQGIKDCFVDDKLLIDFDHQCGFSQGALAHAISIN
jgi:hypothetical protein